MAAAEGNVEGGISAAWQGERRDDARERRRGHAARARERVCVRLINQTFTFGILAREKEEELEIAKVEVVTGQGERTKRSTRRRRCRPGRVEHEARAGPSRTGQQPVFQKPSSEFAFYILSSSLVFLSFLIVR